MQIRVPASSTIDFESNVEKIFKKYKLQKNILQSSPNIWTICSNEIFLKNKITDLIKKNFYPQTLYGQVLHMPLQNFDWEGCILEAKSHSLFSEKKVFDIRLSSAKPSTRASKALIEWCENLTNFSDLILNLPSIDYATRQSNWFNTIDNFGITIIIPSPDNQEMKKWLVKILTQKKLSLTDNAVDLVVEKCEGNLSMAEQQIQKILLLSKSEKLNNKVDSKFIQKTVTDVAKYNPFDLPDLIFKVGNKRNCIRLINGLREEGFPATLIVWILAKECRNKKQPTKKKLLKKLFLIDRMVKGLVPGDPWIELEIFVLQD